MNVRTRRAGTPPGRLRSRLGSGERAGVRESIYESANQKSRKREAVSLRTVWELPMKTNLEFKQRNLAQSPPRTQRNSPRYEQPILPIIHVDHLHLRVDQLRSERWRRQHQQQPFVGREDPRTRQAERVYLCAETRTTFVRRHGVDERG